MTVLSTPACSSSANKKLAPPSARAPQDAAPLRTGRRRCPQFRAQSLLDLLADSGLATLARVKTRTSAASTAPVRRMPIAAFIGMVVAYLVVIQVVGRVATAGLHEDFGQFTTIAQVARGLVLPIGLSVIFVYGLVAVLGWNRPVFIDDRPVQRWVWTIPSILALSILAAINYGGLGHKSIGFVVLLVLGALMVGFAEEGLFRGIGVTTFRVNGFPEGRVALWSSVVFGAAHLTNVFSGSGSAVAQAVIVTFAGYFFYLTRRVSRGLIIPSILHGMFDFSLISTTVVNGKAYAGALAAIAAYLIIAIVLLARRHHIEPATDIPPGPEKPAATTS
jgi:hypothetical protein